MLELDLEHPADCLTVGRDEENGTLLWWYGAPDGADLEDERSGGRATPPPGLTCATCAGNGTPPASRRPRSGACT
jgi:hypothetical protein